jgi:hypothetical protein
MGNHVSDWEHVTVRCEKFVYNGSNYLKPTYVSVQAHSLVYQYTWAEMTKAYTTHVRVFCALGSHGMWKDAGTHVYEDIVIAQLSDVTSVGTVWNTWQTPVQAYQYNPSTKTGVALGSSAWPTYFNRDYTSATSKSAYYWGNMASGSVFGYDMLTTGPRGPESTTSLTSSSILK